MYKIKENPEDFIVDEVIELKIDSSGNYSYFLLKKINVNTEDAVRRIADYFNINRKKINYCGTKDKVAVTTQYISIENLDKGNRKDHELKDISLKYKGQGIERLNLGTHKGNNFEIVVTSDNPPKKIEKVLNKFGEQRFSFNNQDVGKEIVKGNFKKAIELILENNGNQEDKISLYLANNPNDYVGALRTIPKKIVMFYIHAYQSYLFNIICKDWKSEKVPLIGFGTDPTLVQFILNQEGISTRNFIIRQFPEISSEGDIRDKYVEIENLKIEKIEEEKYKINFYLPKGSYATVVISALFS